MKISVLTVVGPSEDDAGNVIPREFMHHSARADDL
jgi:hypothetical protein